MDTKSIVTLNTLIYPLLKDASICCTIFLDKKLLIFPYSNTRQVIDIKARVIHAVPVLRHDQTLNAVVSKHY